MSELSKNLREFRICKGVTQKKLAAYLHCSPGTISNYENGVHEPSNDMLVRLAAYYNVSLDYLLGRYNGSPLHDILSRPIYDGYTIGHFLQLLPLLKKPDLVSLVHYFRILEELRNS